MRTIDIIQSKFIQAKTATPSKPISPADDLRQHLALCHDILTVVERESQVLRGGEPADLRPLAVVKKSLLDRLNISLDRIRQQRLRWQQLSPAERAENPEVGGLLRQNQDLIMKIILLDRENEQALLRGGLIPAAQLPPAQRQRPHFVAELYRRQGARLE
jgi:flagellar biosynthesis/type III secretory pathway chaperone